MFVFNYFNVYVIKYCMFKLYIVSLLKKNKYINLFLKKEIKFLDPKLLNSIRFSP